MTKWHDNILPRAAKKALNFLSKQEWLKRSGWYLAGGTALALQAGHRKSLDLDFFISKSDFSLTRFIQHLPDNIWKTNIARDKTIYGELLGAKVSFIAYPFFHPKELPKYYGFVRVLSENDIAVMKIVAISQRGKKRDFVDLYWYVNHVGPLLTVMQKLPEQYPAVAHDYHHILKSLMYFDDAEKDPMPELSFKASWKTIKAYFKKEVPKVARQLLGIK